MRPHSMRPHFCLTNASGGLNSVLPFASEHPARSSRSACSVSQFKLSFQLDLAENHKCVHGVIRAGCQPLVAAGVWRAIRAGCQGARNVVRSRAMSAVAPRPW
jgi:hypothetical protein